MQGTKLLPIILGTLTLIGIITLLYGCGMEYPEPRTLCPEGTIDTERYVSKSLQELCSLSDVTCYNETMVTVHRDHCLARFDAVKGLDGLIRLERP